MRPVVTMTANFELFPINFTKLMTGRKICKSDRIENLTIKWRTSRKNFGMLLARNNFLKQITKKFPLDLVSLLLLGEDS